VKTEHTLRYLLLRHLKKLERRVRRDLFLEATRSLRVAVDRSAYVVTWQARGEQHEKSFPRSAFAFYRRGDTDAAMRDDREDLGTGNDALARAFAEEVFGVPPTPAGGAAQEPIEPYASAGIVEAVAVALATGAIGGLPAWNAVALAAVLLVEFGRHGRLRSAFLFLPLAAFGPSTAAALGALAYGLLQFLDPDPTGRRLRVGVCLLAVGLAALRPAGVHFGWIALAVAVSAAAITAARSLYSSHRRAVPLTLPSYALGLFLDGSVAGSLCLLAVVGAGTLAAAFVHRWSPLQQERTLTPNG
jgi:hypothetical protein